MVKFTIPNFKPTHTLNDFEFLHDPRDDNLKLGAGSLAAVRLAQEKKSGKLVALKTVELNNITETDLHNLKSEILIHKDLDHPNIIKFHGYIQHGDLVYIILDYATNGNLYNYLQCKKKLTDKEVFRFFHQACLATNYLHQKDILHRDIKPENILLDQDFNIKLCDFGWSVRNINQKRSTFCGTYEYMAPEIIREQTYDYRVDIWAIGVLLFELIHNKPPYKGRSLPEIKSSLSKDKITFKQGIQQDLKRLIQKILDHNPEKRIGFDLILSCSWVNEHLEREINFRRSVYQGDIIGRGSRFGNVSSKLKIFDDSAETQPSKPDTNNSLPQEIQSPQIEPNEPAKDLDRFSTRKRISTVASLYSVPTDLNSNHNTNRSKQSSSLASVLNQEKPVEGVSHRKRIFDENFLSPTFSYRLDHVIEKLKQPKEYERKFTESSVLKANQNQTMRNLTEFDPENSYQNPRFETKKFNQSLLSSQTSVLASPAVSPRTGIFQGSNSLIQSESNKVVTFEKFKNLSFVKDVRSFFDKVSIPSCRKPQI